jgi:predicted nucleotidyltransferase
MTERLIDLFWRYKVKIAYLFGSQAEKGIEFLKGQTTKPEKGSDLDIAVVFNCLLRMTS